MNQNNNKLIRINKFISNSGVCSRRQADELILKGKVYLNNKKIKTLGIKISNEDIVKIDGKIISKEKKEYLILNKPKDFITTLNDPQNRKTVKDLIKGATKKRLYPVGRLDRNTTGLLIFTNDGELSKKLTHPSYKIKKIYHVEIEKAIELNDFKIIENGFKLDGEKIKVDKIAILDKEKKNIGLEIHIGKNRILRRIFEHLNYKVKKLDRVMIGSITKKNLKRGSWRFLKDSEVRLLKNFS
tara:strand:+ start:3016 stop:3741 length:726 start_codon:yes stop_codon:yes gene_type:complete